MFVLFNVAGVYCYFIFLALSVWRILLEAYQASWEGSALIASKMLLASGVLELEPKSTNMQNTYLL